MSISPLISEIFFEVEAFFSKSSSVLSFALSIILSAILITAINAATPAMTAPTGFAAIAAFKPLNVALNLPTSGEAALKVVVRAFKELPINGNDSQSTPFVLSIFDNPRKSLLTSNFLYADV